MKGAVNLQIDELNKIIPYLLICYFEKLGTSPWRESHTLFGMDFFLIIYYQSLKFLVQSTYTYSIEINYTFLYDLNTGSGNKSLPGAQREQNIE